jgi:uncharacterized membrane protein YcaP (DUF421 family)
LRSPLTENAQVRIEFSQGQFSTGFWADVLLAILMTIVATSVIYLVFVTLIRVLGTRTLANLSTFDFACMVAVGAVVGRTAVLAKPNLLTGVVALMTLFALQGTFGFIRARERGNRWVNPRPVVLARDGVVLHDALRRVHLVEDELRFAVRRAGLPGLAAVGLVVLESNGSISVIRAAHREAWLEADLPSTPVADLAVADSGVSDEAGTPEG